MHIYDTLIIGCSYVSVGYAIGKKNCIICEKTELCDTHFGASLCGFEIRDYTPLTYEGKALHALYSDMNLLKNDMQNLNAFECAFCKYITNKDLDVLLKCTVIDIALQNEMYIVTVITNSGIEKLYAKKIKDFSNTGTEFITVQFVSDDVDNDIPLIKSAFGNVKIEKAFYENRFAAYIPTLGLDINMIKLEIYNRWHVSETKAKILHIPSAMFSKNKKKICDEMFDSFLEAFEYGIKEAE